MIVYYSICGYLLYLGIMKKFTEKYEKSEYIIAFAAASVLFIFAAMRSINIGADTEQYVSHFLKIADIKWDDFGSYTNGWYGDIETGYKVYNKLLSVFRNQQTITIANSVLQIGLISIVIMKQSKDWWLSFFLYFAFCFYQTALNLTPSSFVSYFMFLSFPYIKEQKLIKFLIFVVIGMLFHTSAVFFIPLYFLSKLKINKKIMSIAISGGILIYSFFTFFVDIALMIIPQKYASYIDDSRGYRENSVEIIVLFVQLAAIFFCLLQIEKGKRINIIKENNFITWLIFYEIILYFLSFKASMFQRGAFLFTPYVVIIIPYLISNIKSQKRKNITTLCIFVYATALYIARVQVNNVGTTMPYELFFDEVKK